MSAAVKISFVDQLGGVDQLIGFSSLRYGIVHIIILSMKTKTTCPICKTEFTRIHTKGQNPIYCSRACANKAPGRMTPEISAKNKRRGPDHPHYKGGQFGGGDGKTYFYVLLPYSERGQYPTETKRGYIRRSHYVWNKSHPDNLVRPGQIIHHNNGNPKDDRPENYTKVNSHSEHMKFHRDEISRRITIRNLTNNPRKKNQ